MPETTPTLHVRITTARRDVFSDWVDGAEIRTADGSIRLVPNQHAYLSFEGACRLCLRRGANFVFFNLRNSVAHVAPQHLRVLAEDAQQSDNEDKEAKEATKSDADTI